MPAPPEIELPLPNPMREFEASDGDSRSRERFQTLRRSQPRLDAHGRWRTRRCAHSASSPSRLQESYDPPPLWPPPPVAGAFTVRLAEPLAVPPGPVQASAELSEPVGVGVVLTEPLVGSEPDHAPLAVQLVALVEDHKTVTLAP